jgi:DNA-binding transcriptional MerR regulator
MAVSKADTADASEAGATPHGPLDPAQQFGIQEAATLLGVTMRTLRFYEDKELISPMRVGTARIYTRREIGRMQLILRGKRLGFSIREIQEFLDLYDVDPEHQVQVQKLVVKVSDRIEQLRHQKVAIEQTLEELLTIEAQAREWLRKHPGAPTEESASAHV